MLGGACASPVRQRAGNDAPSTAFRVSPHFVVGSKKEKTPAVEPPGRIARLQPCSADQGRKSLWIRAVTERTFWSVICVPPPPDWFDANKSLLGGFNCVLCRTPNDCV